MPRYLILRLRLLKQGLPKHLPLRLVVDVRQLPEGAEEV
jgi:hypothetical protein